jgi:hypothetical protein
MAIGSSKKGITMACPKCAVDPLVTASNESDCVPFLSDLIGRQCIRCSYEILSSDIDVATIAALERLLLERSRNLKP